MSLACAPVRRSRAIRDYTGTMNEPDRRLVVRLDPVAPLVAAVQHPCRCDAPDPETARYEPLVVPVGPLLAHGRCLVVCPECDYHLLVTVAGSETSEGGSARPSGSPA